jgi:uncharacterized protein YrrD
MARRVDGTYGRASHAGCLRGKKRKGIIMLRHAKSLEDFEFQASDGPIGHVKDVYFDDERWHLRYFVVQAGSWLAGRRVLISPEAVTAPRFNERALVTGLTKEQVRNSPDVSTDQPVSRQQEVELHRYYAWPQYWASPVLGTGYVAPIAPAAAPTAAALRSVAPPDYESERESSIEADRREAEKRDPHLRSAHAIRGYRIEATDGPIGHVEDFLVDDAGWAVRHLLVDTRNWWPGKKVLVPLQAIRDIDWSQSALRVDLTREAIKAGPEFDPAQPLAEDYADRLEAHYRRSRGR